MRDHLRDYFHLRWGEKPGQRGIILWPNRGELNQNSIRVFGKLREILGSLLFGNVCDTFGHAIIHSRGRNVFGEILDRPDQRCQCGDQYCFQTSKPIAQGNRNDQAPKCPTTFQHENAVRFTESFRLVAEADSPVRNSGRTHEATRPRKRTRGRATQNIRPTGNIQLV